MNASSTNTTSPTVWDTRCGSSGSSRQSRPRWIRCASAGAGRRRRKDCGGPVAFQERRDAAPWQAQELLSQIVECVDQRDVTGLRNRIDEIGAVKEWLLLDKFDRRKVIRRLRQYATGDEEWRWN